MSEQDMKDLVTLEEVIVPTPAAAWFSSLYICILKILALYPKIE